MNWAPCNPREPRSRNTGTSQTTANSRYEAWTIVFFRGGWPAMGAFIMDSRKLLLLLMILGLSQISRAQSPTYGVGRTPTAEEIRKLDISIGPEGKELPPGRGTAVEGAGVFSRKGWFTCRGETGQGG